MNPQARRNYSGADVVPLTSAVRAIGEIANSTQSPRWTALAGLQAGCAVSTAEHDDEQSTVPARARFICKGFAIGLQWMGADLARGGLIREGKWPRSIASGGRALPDRPQALPEIIGARSTARRYPSAWPLESGPVCGRMRARSA